MQPPYINHKDQSIPQLLFLLPMQSYTILRRNLVYTAITRGKKLVVIIGEKKAFAMVVKHGKISNRYSKLKDWLQLRY